MRKFSTYFTAVVSAAVFTQVASAADMPVKAGPPPVVVTSGWFFSVTGGYYFDDPYRDFFISPNNGGGPPGTTCCGSGFGDGFGTRGVLGYRFGVWDVAVAGGYATFSRGKLNPSYAGSAFLHAPKGHYWFVDGELGYNTRIDVLKARVFVGPRFVRWNMKDNDGQPPTTFTFDAKSEAVGPRVGFALSGPSFLPNIGWMAEGSFSYLFGEITGTVGGFAAVASRKVDRNIKNAELRAGLEWNVWTASKLTIGWQAEFWSGALPKYEYDGFSNPGVTGRAEHLHHGPFARFSYGL